VDFGQKSVHIHDETLDAKVNKYENSLFTLVTAATSASTAQQVSKHSEQTRHGKWKEIYEIETSKKVHSWKCSWSLLKEGNLLKLRRRRRRRRRRRLSTAICTALFLLSKELKEFTFRFQFSICAFIKSRWCAIININNAFASCPHNLCKCARISTTEPPFAGELICGRKFYANLNSWRDRNSKTWTL